MIWFGLACKQHFAGLPGGRVGGLGLAPGGAGGQLVLMVSVEEVLQPLCRISWLYSLK